MAHVVDDGNDDAMNGKVHAAARARRRQGHLIINATKPQEDQPRKRKNVIKCRRGYFVGCSL